MSCLKKSYTNTTKSTPIGSVIISTLFAVGKTIYVPLIVLSVILNYGFIIWTFHLLSPHNIAFLSLLQIIEYLGYFLSLWFIPNGYKLLCSRTQSSGVTKDKRLTISLAWRLFIFIAVVSAITLGGVMEMIGRHYWVSGSMGIIFAFYFTGWFLTIFECFLVYRKNRKRVFAFTLFITALIKSIAVLSLAHYFKMPEVIFISFALSSIGAWLSILLLGRTFAEDGVVKLRLARVLSRENKISSCNTLYFWNQWEIFPLLVSPLFAVQFFTPVEAGISSSLLWIGQIPMIVALVFWTLLIWFYHLKDMLLSKRYVFIPRSWILLTTAIGIVTASVLNSGVLFKILGISGPYANIFPTILWSSVCSMMIFVIYAWYRQRGSSILWWLVIFGGLLLILILPFHSLLTIVVAQAVIMTVILLTSLGFIIFYENKMIVKRNIEGIRLFVNGNDIPPVQRRLGTVRILLLARIDNRTSHLAEIRNMLGKWKRKGYDVVLFCDNDAALPAYESKKNFSIIRRGGRYSKHLFILLYSWFRFRDQFDVLVSVKSDLYICCLLSIYLPVIYVRSARRRKSCGITYSIARLRWKMANWLSRSFPFLTLSMSKVSKLDMNTVSYKASMGLNKHNVGRSRSVLGRS